MARKRTKKQTLSEFRAWLSGVEELQPADWAPNAEQWKTIREKINNIIESEDSYVDTATLTKLIEQVAAPTMTARPGIAMQQPPNPQAVGIPPAPMPPAGVPNGPIDVAPAAESAQPPVSLPPAQPIDIVDVAKPKDTSENGKYESSFI